MTKVIKLNESDIQRIVKRVLNEQMFKNKIQLKPIDELDFRDIEDLSINYYEDGERFNFWDFMIGNYFPLKINGDDCNFKIRKEDGKEYNLIIKDKEKVDKSTVYKLMLPKELEVESGSAEGWFGEMIINCKGKQTTMDWEMTD